MQQLKNIKLTIAYDGTDYAGWQRQKNKKTIQGIIEDTIRKLTDEKKLKLYAAGRTDAGVHALGQVANFKTSSGIPLEKWLVILNNLLPKDIRVILAEEAAQEFNSRFSARSRLYRYYILDESEKSEKYYEQEVFLGRYCYFQNSLLDLERIRKAAQHLVGVHDFSGLSCLNNAKKNQLFKNNIRNIKRFNIIKKNKVIIFSMEADAFLYKMARIIVGTLIKFSKEKREPEEILRILASKDSQKSGPAVPPNGLYLVAVKY